MCKKIGPLEAIMLLAVLFLPVLCKLSYAYCIKQRVKIWIVILKKQDE